MNKPEKNLKSRKNKRFNPLKTSNIIIPEEKNKAAQWVHALLWIVLAFILVFSVANMLLPQFLWAHFEVVNFPLHSSVEALGAIAAILVAFMPLQVLFGKYKPSYLFISTGFLGMGFWDFFHSFFEVGDGFVFTHSVALLAGGFFFALFVFPWKINVDKAKKYILFFFGLVTILFAVVASLNREAFPEMIHDGVFTSTANMFNMLAGLLFLISAIKLFVIYIKEKNLGVLILFFTATISALVGITFQYSGAWSDGWWLWHAIRLIAFLSLLGYMFWRIQAVSQERNEALDSIKEKHNQLQASEERFSLVNEATKQGLWDWNVPKNEVYFSPVWKMQVGYKDDELENDFANWAKLLHPEDKERCLKAVDDYLKVPEGKFILEFRFQHKDGHYVWIHNQAASVKDKDGNVLRMFGAHTDITAQKEAEEKLKEQEKKFRIIFENSPIGKSQTGLDGSLNINKAFSEITGYNLEELKQKNWKEITHPDDIKESEEIIKSLIAGEKDSARFEKRYLHKNGHYVWTEVNTSLNRNEAGEPQFFITTISDITQRKEAEKQIKQSEKKFKGLFESDPSAIIIADPQTGILQDVNPAAEKLMEMSRDELIGLHQSKLHPEDVMQEQIEKFKKLQGQPNVTVSSEVLSKNGKRKPVEINVSMVEIENKPYILGIFHDVSKLVEQQQKLKESEVKHRAIFESAKDAFIIVNTKGNIIEVNPAACKTYGYEHDEMVGMTAAKLIHPDNLYKFDDFQKDIQEKGNYFGETLDMRKDGTTFYSEVQGSLITFDNQPHMLEVIRDVTEKKKWENELKLKNIVYESSVAANSTADLEGNLTSVNQSFLDIWGYKSKNEVLGKPISEFIKYEEESGKILKGLDAEEKWQGNYTALKKDGSTFIAQANAGVLHNAEGEKIGYQSSVFDVSEAIEAEKQVLKEKEFTDSVINAMPGVFYLFNENGKFLKWNKTMEKLSGSTPEEVGQKSPLEFIATHHHEKVAKAIQTAFETGYVTVEADFNSISEAPIPHLFSGKIITPGGEPLLVGIGIDITKRKSIEQEKEKALHALNERVKEMTCLFEVNDVIKNPDVSIPEVMRKITQSIPKGWHYPEKTAVEIVLDEEMYQSKNFSDSNHFLQESIFIQNQKRGYIKVTVSDLDIQQSKEPFFHEEKELLKTIAANISIYVHRVESEIEIRESEENFRNVYSNSPVSLWQEDWTEIINRIDALKKKGVNDFKKYFSQNKQFVNDALTKVIINDVNQATLTMFEAESKDDLVKSLEVVFATEDTLPGFIGELIALAEGKRIYETEMKLNTAKGNLVNTMLRMSFPSEDVQDGQVLVSIMDITDLKVAQEQLKVSMENLKRSNKELERFAYVASHDLQEPLRMVSSYTQLLERRYKGQMDERADKYIYYAVDGANRMQNLINDLLDFSRISTRGEKFTTTDTSEALKNTLTNLENRINETGAQIKTGKLPVIKADSGQIERLFLNLIGNALKFSKSDEKPVIEINAKSQKNKWLFTVKDNGIGIDEKFKEKVFVIFQRLHGASQYKGTGIGLAICKRIVQRHDGEIWFESEENKGTTFFFTLKKHKLDV